MGGPAVVSLDALRLALREEAESEAEGLLADAEYLGRTEVAAARGWAATLVAKSRSTGEADVETEVARRRARARRAARGRVLKAQRVVYEAFRAEAVSAAQDFRADPAYRVLLERLAERGRTQLGENAQIEIDPPDGGVVARANGRRVDYSLPALVDRCIATLGGHVERLWE